MSRSLRHTWKFCDAVATLTTARCLGNTTCMCMTCLSSNRKSRWKIPVDVSRWHIVTHAVFCRKKLSSNLWDVPHVFEVARESLPSTSISILTCLDPETNIVPLSANDVSTRAENNLYVARYYLLTVLWCDAPESHSHLSERLMLFTFTAEKAEPVVSSTDDWSMHSVTSNLLLSASVSDISFQDDQTCHSENRCGFVCCVWLNYSTHLVYSTLYWLPPIGTRGWCMCRE